MPKGNPKGYKTKTKKIGMQKTTAPQNIKRPNRVYVSHPEKA